MSNDSHCRVSTEQANAVHISSLIVGILAVAHIGWSLSVISWEVTILASGQLHSINVCTGFILSIDFFWKASLLCSLWASFAALYSLHYAVKSLSKKDLSDANLRGAVLSRLFWITFTTTTILSLIIIVVVAARTSSVSFSNDDGLCEFSPDSAAVKLEIGIISFIFFSSVLLLIISTFYTYKLTNLMKKRHSAYHIPDVKIPHLHAFLFLISSIITRGPRFVMDIQGLTGCSDHSNVSIVVNSFSLIIGVLDCVIYCSITREVRQHYAEKWWAIVPNALLSPIMIPHAFYHWTKNLRSRHSKRLSTKSPLLVRGGKLGAGLV
ncbi:hypothetical protein PROFUN_07375 [Planoprotostelium fungivorum]|uniref:Uncharacterized protein n=1 Tax=Planoprotostelium fungivorum TaxID=1890364 RepID=A0A2P6MTE6_9EUKA|nr:hypothetical protein PROFUN_07375 [Planoprotostelium fungivorum]